MIEHGTTRDRPLWSILLSVSKTTVEQCRADTPAAPGASALGLLYHGVARILFLTGSIGTNGEGRIEALAVKCSDRLKTTDSESIPQECSH